MSAPIELQAMIDRLFKAFGRQTGDADGHARQELKGESLVNPNLPLTINEELAKLSACADPKLTIPENKALDLLRPCVDGKRVTPTGP